MKKNQNLMIAIIVMVLILVIGVFLMLLRGDEDTWLCQNGQWVKHGHPSAPQPSELCGGAINENQNQNNDNADVAGATKNSRQFCRETCHRCAKCAAAHRAPYRL